jgi:hypothetical protein
MTQTAACITRQPFKKMYRKRKGHQSWNGEVEMANPGYPGQVVSNFEP